MRDGARARRAIAVTGGLVLSVFAATPALAFNTKYHEDLTVGALEDAGFRKDEPLALELVQVSSWFTDFYALDPASLALELHFDDLTTAEEVVKHWQDVGAAVDRKLDELVAKKDPGAVLLFLGLVLHGVQDFYSHSNWADIDWTKRGRATDVIYEEVPLRELLVVEDPKGRGLLTGVWSLLPGKAAAEGTVGHSDLHKDHAGRPGFEAAFGMARRDTARWVERFRKRLEHEPGLDFASLAAYRDGPTEKLAHAALRFAEHLSKAVGSWDDSKPEPLQGVTLVELKNELPAGDDLAVAWDGLMRSFARALKGDEGKDESPTFRDSTPLARAAGVKALVGTASLYARGTGELGKALTGVADKKLIGEVGAMLAKIGKSLESAPPRQKLER